MAMYDRTKDAFTTIKPPLICVPVLAEGIDDLLKQVLYVMDHRPDLIEWRADGFGWRHNTISVFEIIKGIKEIINRIPLIFTLRRREEGGLGNITEDLRLRIIKDALLTYDVDYLDLELSTCPENIRDIRETAVKTGAQLMLSYHDFDKTPTEEALSAKVRRARELGADMIKIAVTARDPGDVLKLLAFTYRIKNEGLNIPITIMAMGRLGTFARIATGFFGSDIIYASGTVATASGQISVWRLRDILDIIYDNTAE